MTIANMNKWLKQYEQFRTNPFEKNEAWSSTKYDINGMTWTEISEIVLEDLPDKHGIPMKFGKACDSLIKTWYHLKLTKLKGEPIRDLAWRINMIQDAMGIEPTRFEEEDDEDDGFGQWEGL